MDLDVTNEYITLHFLNFRQFFSDDETDRLLYIIYLSIEMDSFFFLKDG
jgi:hypothetical protein